MRKKNYVKKTEMIKNVFSFLAYNYKRILLLFCKNYKKLLKYEWKN